MRRGVRPCTAAIVTVACLWGAPRTAAQSIPDARLFQKLAGSWSGTGTVALAGGADERIRCRADYSAPSPSRLRLALRCASDSFAFQVASDVSREGNRITGTWSEASTGVSGELTGTAGSDRIDVTSAGLGFSAHLSVTVRGPLQVVHFALQGQMASTAAVTLRRP